MVRLTARGWTWRTPRTAWAAVVVCASIGLSAMLSGQAPADVTAPAVRITLPAEDATVSGTVTITADVTDAGGVAGVIFEVDGQAIGAEVLVAPWSLAWNAGASGSGSHILSAVARDVAGNAVRSALVPVVVGGAAPPAFPPLTNHNPTPTGDALTSVDGAPVTFTSALLLVNDTDPDGHWLSVTLVAASSSGGGTIVSNGGGSYTYTPAAGFTGIDRFTYSIADGFGGTASAAVNVIVTSSTAPPPDGLVLALGFDEDAGVTARDASGGARDGTITGAQRVTGRFGGALQFDGVDDWVTVPDSAALDLSSGMTLEAWVNPSATPSGWNTIMLKERGVEDMAYALYGNDGGPLPGGTAAPAAYVNVAGSQTSMPGVAALAPGTWTHLAATYDGATLRIFVDGSLQSSRARTGLIVDGVGPLRIGGNSAWPGEFFAGTIDDVRIYNRALTAAEIATDMGGLAPPPPPPVNQAPTAMPDTFTTPSGTPVAITAALLLANDTDPDGHPLTVSSVAATGSAGGVVTITGAGAWSYLPASGFTGADTIAYTVSDGFGGSAIGTINVTVTAVTPPPAGAAGLVLALGFDEAAGTVAADSSGGARNGTVREAAFVAGRYGNALSFDGVDDWVTVPHSAALALTNGLTIEAWVKPSALSGWQTLVLKERGTEDLAYGLYAHDGAPLAGGTAAPAGTISSSAGHRAVHAPSPLIDGVWTHVATTYDGATQRFYVNGALVASRAQTGAMSASTSPLRIGGNNAWSGEFFRGLIDEVRIYNRALSAAEVQADMNTPVR